MPARTYVEGNGSATMLAAKRSTGAALGVNLKECLTHTPPPSVNKAAHSSFKTQRRHHLKSKTGVSAASQRKNYIWQDLGAQEVSFL